MKAMQKTLNSIVLKMKDQKLRERESGALRDLAGSFGAVNAKLDDVILPAKFCISNSPENEDVHDAFDAAITMYSYIQSEIVRSWGSEVKNPDILDPEPFEQGLNELKKALEDLRIKILDHYSSLSKEVIGDARRARNLHSLRPDLGINLEPFSNAEKYLDKNFSNIPQMRTYLDTIGLQKCQKEWEKIFESYNKEKKKINDIDDLGLSNETLQFIERLNNSHRFLFKNLSPTVVEEINEHLPDLASKLVIREFEN